jgi:phospholipid/cholesterol/gamma-HCH transport system substrate-binding protein
MRTFVPQLLKFTVFAVVTVLLTTVLATTIANVDLSRDATYTARFTDATGLNPGDDVRMAGVRVGQVKSIDLVDRSFAAVRFEVEARRKLPTSATATIKYRNLIGQRFLALGMGAGNGNDLFAPGATIPADRTRPALNLTVLFNGFKPLFQALSPDQVNQLSFEIIQVLQGEGGTVDSLLSHTASLTSTIAGKDKVIGQVVDNLNTVLGTVNARAPELSATLDQTQQLVSGLSAQRSQIGDAISALGELTNTTGGLLKDVRDPLKQDVGQLGTVSATLNQDAPELDNVLRHMPSNVEAITRTASYAGWFNYFACRMSGTIGIGSLGVQVPIFPLPNSELPERCKN